MVPRKFRVSEIFVPISKSRRRFDSISYFLCVSDSRIFGPEVSESRILVCWPKVSIKTMIKLLFHLKRSIAVYRICRRDKSGS